MGVSNVVVTVTNAGGCSANTTLTLTVISGVTPPVANAVTVNRNHGVLYFSISVTNILAQVTPGSSSSISLAGYGSPTITNGVNLRLISNSTAYFLQYTNPVNQVDDRFLYWVQDGNGILATNSVNIHVVDTNLQSAPVTGQVSTNTIGGNTFTVRYYGAINNTYVLQRSTNIVTGVGWVSIHTNTIGSSGYTNVVDDFGDLTPIIPSSAYYRVYWKP